MLVLYTSSLLCKISAIIAWAALARKDTERASAMSHGLPPVSSCWASVASSAARSPMRRGTALMSSWEVLPSGTARATLWESASARATARLRMASAVWASSSVSSRYFAESRAVFPASAAPMPMASAAADPAAGAGVARDMRSRYPATDCRVRVAGSSSREVFVVGDGFTAGPFLARILTRAQECRSAVDAAHPRAGGGDLLGRRQAVRAVPDRGQPLVAHMLDDLADEGGAGAVLGDFGVHPEQAAQQDVEHAGAIAAFFEGPADAAYRGHHRGPDLVHDDVGVAFQQRHHGNEFTHLVAFGVVEHGVEDAGHSGVGGAPSPRRQGVEQRFDGTAGAFPCLVRGGGPGGGVGGTGGPGGPQPRGGGERARGGLFGHAAPTP